MAKVTRSHYLWSPNTPPPLPTIPLLPHVVGGGKIIRIQHLKLKSQQKCNKLKHPHGLTDRGVKGGHQTTGGAIIQLARC